MKKIVSHLSPDIDSITATWLIKHFLPGWSEAEVIFVNAGKTYEGKPADSDAETIHVDTGFGRFDHHQNNEFTCASVKVFNFLKGSNHIKTKYLKPIERIVEQVNEFDHFYESKFTDPDSDRYEFMVHKIIEAGLKNVLHEDLKIMELVFTLLDSILIIFVKKIGAEEELKNGFVFQSRFGKSIVLNSANEETTKLALKKGYSFVAKKHPENGSIRIKTLPDKKYDLTPLYNIIIKEDKKASWYLHVSGNMLLNSSSKNPGSIPSKISTKRLIEIVRSI